MSMVKVFGVPSAAGSREETSYAIDQHHAPAIIRRAYDELTSGFNIPKDFTDLGDLTGTQDVRELLSAVEEKIVDICQSGANPFVLGGAHTLTLGSLRALSRMQKKFSLIYFDAHPDLMPHPQINYGSTLHFALQEGSLRPEQLAYIGIRQIETEEWDAISKRNIFSLTSPDFESLGAAGVLREIQKRFPAPYYISLDLDCLDPSFAPGVTAPCPVGLTPREVLFISRELVRSKVLGIEIVELASVNDIKNQTATLAAFLLQSLSTEMARCFS